MKAFCPLAAVILRGDKIHRGQAPAEYGGSKAKRNASSQASSFATNQGFCAFHEWTEGERFVA